MLTDGGNCAAAPAVARRALAASLDREDARRRLMRDATVRVALLCACYVALLLNVGPWPFFAMAMAIVQIGIVASIYHETVHLNLWWSHSLQRVLGRCLVAPLGFSYSWWRLKHVALHHRFVGDPARDPDIGYEQYGRVKPSQPYRSIYRWQAATFTVALPFAAVNMLRPKELLRVRDARSNQQLLGLLAEKYVPFALVWVPLFVVLGVVPAGKVFTLFFVTSGVFGGTVAQLQHNTELGNRSDTRDVRIGSPVWQFAVTADTRSRSGIWRWFSGGTNRHVVHHLYPSLLYTELEDATAIVRGSVPSWPEHESIWAAVKSLAKMLNRLTRNEPA